MNLPLNDWQLQLTSLAKMPDGVYVVDTQGRLLGANDTFCTLAGRSREAMLGHSLTDLSLVDEAPTPVEQDCYRARWQRPDGSRINVEVSATGNPDGTITCWVHDITDLIAATHAMRRSQAFLEFLIAANALIGRSEDAHTIYREVCRLATELDQRIALAWIGLLDPATQRIEVFTHAGRASAYLDGITISYDPALAEGQGPASRCIREGHLVVIDHFDRDPSTKPWHERARRHALVANASLPFHCHGKPVGALMLYSTEAATFDSELSRLLTELGTGISFALDYFAQRADAARAAEALRQSEQGYRLLADNVRDVIWVMDLASRRLGYISRSVEKLCGYTATEMMQMTPDEMLTADSAAAAARWMEQDIVAWDAGTYTPRTAEVEQRCKHGGTVWVEVVTQLVTDPETGKLQIFGVSRDITVRRQAENRFREVVELATEGIAMIDPDGKLILVNQRFHTMLGHDEGGLLGHAMIDIIHPDDRARFNARFGEVASGRRTETRDARYALLHRDGHRVDVLLSATHRSDAEGHYAGSVGMVTDISMLVASETELRKNLAQQQDLNARLEEARNQLLQSEKMASIGQLAAGVAHELNNPIGFVHSNLGTLESYLRDIFQIIETYEPVEAALGEAAPAVVAIRTLKQRVDYDYLRQDIVQLMGESKDGLNRVRKIVQDLKDFSRVGDAHWQWADLHQGLDSTLNIVWNELKYKCTVTKRYAADLPRIYCLPSQLNQVFMNLLVNAAQAIEPEDGRLGEITISTRQPGTDTVEISIADTGKGIPPESLSHLFEPFFTTKPVGKGTGLGLSIAWGIIARHHGHITVDSHVGSGTTFTIELPVQATGGQEGADTAVPPAPTVNRS